MARYKATMRCYVLGMELQAGQEVLLSVKHEKEIKVGDFAEKRKGKDGKEVSIGYKHLMKVSDEKHDVDKHGTNPVIYAAPKTEELIRQDKNAVFPGS